MGDVREASEKLATLPREQLMEVKRQALEALQEYSTGSGMISRRGSYRHRNQEPSDILNHNRTSTFLAFVCAVTSCASGQVLDGERTAAKIDNKDAVFQDP